MNVIKTLTKETIIMIVKSGIKFVATKNVKLLKNHGEAVLVDVLMVLLTT